MSERDRNRGKERWKQEKRKRKNGVKTDNSLKNSKMSAGAKKRSSRLGTT